MIANILALTYNCPMKLTTYSYHNNRICHIEFPTHLSMVLGLGRPQEFVEHEAFEGQWLTMPEFFDKVCLAEEDDDYIPTLYGVNLPGKKFLEWMERATLTLQESRVRRLLGNDIESCYIIGSIAGDIATLDHEFAHAIYSFSKSYQRSMHDLLATVPHYIEKSTHYMIERKYIPRVFNDERQAFFATSPYAEIVDHFGIDPLWCEPFRQRFEQEKKQIVKCE